jgi:hypothetical protein
MARRQAQEEQGALLYRRKNEDFEKEFVAGLPLQTRRPLS